MREDKGLGKKADLIIRCLVLKVVQAKPPLRGNEGSKRENLT